MLKWEKLLNEYLENKMTAISFYNLISGPTIDLFLLFLKVYIQNLKGSDFEKIAALINDTPIAVKLIGELDSDSKNNIKRSAYFLGMAKNIEGKELVLKKLDIHDNLVFENCAIYLARVNYQEAAFEILRVAERFTYLNRAIIISIFLEFEPTVCELLADRFWKESLNNKINFIIIFRMFKYQEAAPAVLEYIGKISDDEFISESIKYFEEIDYVDAADALKIYLKHDSPDIKIGAIKALTKLGAENLDGILFELINNDEWNVQLAAANCMYDYSEKSNARLFSMAESGNESPETSIARMIISEREIKEI
jgi:HEAT repeat protein